MSTTFESDWENTRLKEQLAAKDDEIRELVTSDNKVVADLSRYVETLEQKIADKNDAYRAACAVVAKMHEAAIGEVVGPVLGVVEVVANVREQLIEAQKQIVILREELATTQSELENERRLSFRNQVAEQGRKPIAGDATSVVFTMRLTPAQRGRLLAIGGAAWVRAQIDAITSATATRLGRL